MHGWRRRALKCDQGSFEENEVSEKHNFPTAFLYCGYQSVAEAYLIFLHELAATMLGSARGAWEHNGNGLAQTGVWRNG